MDIYRGLVQMGEGGCSLLCMVWGMHGYVLHGGTRLRKSEGGAFIEECRASR